MATDQERTTIGLKVTHALAVRPLGVGNSIARIGRHSRCAKALEQAVKSRTHRSYGNSEPRLARLRVQRVSCAVGYVHFGGPVRVRSGSYR